MNEPKIILDCWTETPNIRLQVQLHDNGILEFYLYSDRHNVMTSNFKLVDFRAKDLAKKIMEVYEKDQ